MSAVSDLQGNQTLAKGVTLSQIQPGGKEGPNNVVLNNDQPGGGIWSQHWYLGYPTDPWRVLIPDIRMARNQLWPMHWHDCWIALIILDGTCLVGDWWMSPGDVFIVPEGVEYGPILNGPKGSQQFEIYARDVPGWYSPEYHDHPTLSHLQVIKNGRPARFNVPARFKARPEGSEGNYGNQTTPLAGLRGVKTGHLVGSQRFDLGEPGDPGRGVLIDSRFAPGEEYPPHWHRDWRFLVVLQGSLEIGGPEITKNDVVVIEPGNQVPSLKVGSDGAHLLEVARTAAAVPRIFLDKYRTDPHYKELLRQSTDNVFESV
jgi:quercetin dioxygenase-like cupin family protein